VIVFKKIGFISLLLAGLLVGTVLVSINGFASLRWVPDMGGQQFYCKPVKGVSIEVTRVSWHVKRSDYRYIDAAILWLQSTDGKPHLVKLYLTLEDSDGGVLYQGEHIRLVYWRGTTFVVYFLEDVAAADVTRLGITAVPAMGRRR
jgi:hypothetical protein